jgi:hypothetical protein
LKGNNYVVYAALLTSHDIGEPVYEKDSSGRAVIEINKTIPQAHGHFSKPGITDSWWPGPKETFN